MQCPRCQQDNPSHATFCLACGTPVASASSQARRYADLTEEIEDLRRSLGEALEQRTATGAILHAISRSPRDLPAVLDAVVSNAARLSHSANVSLYQVERDRMRKVAEHEDGPQLTTLRVGETRPISRTSVSGRAIIDRTMIHVRDHRSADVAREFPDGARRDTGIYTTLGFPLLSDGRAIGAFTVYRTEHRPFSESEIALLQTFADQAVIAIENVRLFKELQTSNRELRVALEQQTATSELLKVIGGSTFDLQPVFDTLAENTVRLCEAQRAFVFRFDGELLRVVATHNVQPDFRDWVERHPITPGRHSSTARSALERRTIHIPDVMADPEYTYGAKQVDPIRTVLTVPMLRGGELLGVLLTYRHEVRPFSDSQVALMETFADQAAIAIENARLFNELQARTGELSRSVEQLTALGDVGRAVSSTLDLETVLTTIVSRAVQLSGLDGGVVFEYDEGAEEFVQRVATETGDALAETRRLARIRRGEGVIGRTATTLKPAHVPDITSPGAYEGRLRKTLIESGVRAILAVPMVREGHLIGCLAVTRNQPGDFPAETIDLLRTFATQSALAIQNARLFHEIADKSAQLEVASRHKSEFLANMSHELRTPLNAVIGFSEVLAQGMFGDINEKQTEYLHDILESGRHLLSLINDILDLSKIEAGRMELELTEFDLPQAIQNALTLIRERALRRGIALHHIIGDRVASIYADERKVKQVLLNLLSNAIKFTPEGGRIDVRAAPTDGLVEVSVTDTGVGIAPEEQEVVFEEFRQVGTADKKAEGTGLGLALSRKFIELHGGKICVQSEPGRGSTFTFTLPVRPWPAS
jgi:signal transduction histidine kinase